MKWLKILFGTLAALALLLLALLTVLWLKPPELLRVGANYSAKILCSNVFLAGRDPDDVLRADIQAPGVAILHLMGARVDRERHVVHAGFLGLIGDGLAVDRPGVGCAAVPDGALNFAMHVGAPAPTASAEKPPPKAPPATTSLQPPVQVQLPASTPWPDGTAIEANALIDKILANDAFAGPGMRAIVVVHRGRIAAERYGAGFTAATPLIGWSLTKSVLAGLVGTLIKDGKLTLDQSAGWPAAPGDGRDRIRIADLLAMSSGLRFNEAYGSVSDVTRMLYLQPDMADFARAQPLEHPVGESWSYSSGTANILSRIVQDAAAPLAAAYPRTKLFDPLGMTTAIMETDEDGTLVGSSYMYASARDWARYGQFLAQGGVWHGQELLPQGYVAMMATPVAASGGQYGHGLVWLWGSDATTPGQNPDAAFGIPPDTFWMEGHDGQSIAIIPSRELVVVRLGLTPSRDGYSPQPLVGAVLKGLP